MVIRYSKTLLHGRSYSIDQSVGQLLSSEKSVFMNYIKNHSLLNRVVPTVVINSKKKKHGKQRIWKIRGVAITFPEWVYCITAYRVTSPSKYSLWVAMYLAQWGCQCWKHFWNSFQHRHHVLHVNILKSSVPVGQTLFLGTATSH
jgi:hypothetical protein